MSETKSISQSAAATRSVSKRRLADRLFLRGDYTFVLFAYILLTILFTWPLAANFTTFVNGNVMDVYHEMWYLRTFGNFGGNTPFGPFDNFYTTNILYPNGVPLYFQVTSPVNTILVMLLTPLVGFIASYNIMYMATSFIGAFTMFILVNYLTKNKYAALFAGLVYGFAPVHNAQGLAHLNIMSSELIPLYVYFLIKMVRESRFRNGIFAGVLLVLNAMLDIHMLLMAVTITVGFLFFYLIFQRRSVLSKPFIRRLLVMVIIAGLLGVAAYFNTLYGIFFAPKAIGAGAAATISKHLRRSADLSQFLLPGPENPILGRFTFADYQSWGIIPDVRTYIGWTALVLAVFGLVVNRKKRDVWFWGFITAVAFVFSLGPFVAIDGKATPIPGIWYYLYYFIPLFRSFRTPYRFDIVVMFGIAILAGYGVARIISGLNNNPTRRRFLSPTFKRILIVTFLCALLIIEFLPAPYPELDARPPPYLQILENDHSSYAVLDVPTITTDRVYMFYQTYYNQPAVVGQISRTPTESLSFLEQTPFINELGIFLPGQAPRVIINQNVSSTAVAPYILAEYHIKYIVVHRDLMPPNNYNTVMAFVSSVIGMPIYQDSTVSVFRFNDPPGLGLAQFPVDNGMAFYSLLYGGWYKFGSPINGSQAMDFFAGADVFATSNQLMQVKFTVKGWTANYPLQVSVNGQVVGTYVAFESEYTTYSTPFLPVHSGLNQVTFFSINGCSTRSVAVPKQGKISSHSCVSVAFQSIEIVPGAAIS